MNKYRVKIEQITRLSTWWEGEAESPELAKALALGEAYKISISEWSEETCLEATEVIQTD